jgi:hypothetical protein
MRGRGQGMRQDPCHPTHRAYTGQKRMTDFCRELKVVVIIAQQHAAQDRAGASVSHGLTYNTQYKHTHSRGDTPL